MNTDVKMVLFFGALLAVMAAVEVWKATPVGTKSVLVGVHQFLIHPLFVAFGWYLAYGFGRVHIGARPYRRTSPGGWTEIVTKVETASLWRPALWVAFFVHDLGYLGKPNMDGPEGERHPELGAHIMQRLFGEPWGDFCLLHSRYYAKKKSRPLSPLCFADKWVFILEPAILYLPRAFASGEIHEFVRNNAARATTPGNPYTPAEQAEFLTRKPLHWYRAARRYTRRWIDNHLGGTEDRWTRARHVDAPAEIGTVAVVERPVIRITGAGADEVRARLEASITQLQCRRSAGRMA